MARERGQEGDQDKKGGWQVGHWAMRGRKAEDTM